MKKFLLIGLFLIFSLPAVSQALENSSSYKAAIKVFSGDSSESKSYYYFYVSAIGTVRMYDKANNTYYTFKQSNTTSNSQSTVYTWLNNGGIWSESQTFVFTKDKISSDISIFLMRVVQNEGDEPWQAYGVGTVEKE
jgi:hypothetical protein